MRMSTVIALLLAAHGLAGCGGSRSSTSPVAPSTVIVSPAPAPVVPQALYGYVGDTGFRPVAGARVDVLDGAQAGTVVTSDADGRFSYTGVFSPAVTMRATKEGYATATARTITGTASVYMLFNLVPLAPPVQVAGNYSLTITADSACAGIPDDLRTRSYTATLTSNPSSPLNTRFDGTVTGGQFAPYSNLFWVGVAGDYVGVTTEGEGPSIVEQVGPNRYVAYYGSSGASVGTSALTTFSAPFKGVIEYCELKSPIGLYYDCSPSLADVSVQCTSDNSRLSLTRR